MGYESRIAYDVQTGNPGKPGLSSGLRLLCPSEIPEEISEGPPDLQGKGAMWDLAAQMTSDVLAGARVWAARSEGAEPMQTTSNTHWESRRFCVFFLSLLQY